MPEPTITYLLGIVDFGQVKQKMIRVPQVIEKRGKKVTVCCKSIDNYYQQIFIYIRSIVLLSLSL